jgi:MFS family permease
MKHASPFRALRSPNYRLYFIGQTISLTGYWLTRIAVSWLVYRLTHSVVILGWVNFAGQIPSLLLMPLAGVLVDRFNKHKLLFWTQFFLMIPSFILAALTLSGHIQVWHIMVLMVLQGTVQALDVPTRQAFVVEMVEKRNDLANAIALNSSMFNVARMVGPALGGILIALVGEGLCFLLDGISYFAVLASIAAMKIHVSHSKKGGHVLHQFKEGFVYVFGFSPVRYLLFMVGWTSFFGMSYLVLMPVVARDLLHGGPSTLGFLTGASGIGALGGAIFLATRRNIIDCGKFISLACIIGGTGLLLFSFARNLQTAVFFVVLSGFGFMLQLASSNSVLQSIVDDDKRGRVMSFYTLSFLGVAPFGSLFASHIADVYGVRTALQLGGFACMVSGIWFKWQFAKWFELLKPVYARKGLIQDVEPGV